MKFINFCEQKLAKDRFENLECGGDYPKLQQRVDSLLLQLVNSPTVFPSYHQLQLR